MNEPVTTVNQNPYSAPRSENIVGTDQDYQRRRPTLSGHGRLGDDSGLYRAVGHTVYAYDSAQP